MLRVALYVSGQRVAPTYQNNRPPSLHVDHALAWPERSPSHASIGLAVYGCVGLSKSSGGLLTKLNGTEVPSSEANGCSQLITIPYHRGPGRPFREKV